MIISYKIFEGILNKKYDLKSDLVKIFNRIDKNIINHIEITNGYKDDSEYANSKTYFVTYDGQILAYLEYNRENSFKMFIFRTHYFVDYTMSYYEYLKRLSVILKDFYRLKKINIKSLEDGCLFFDKKIFNNNIIQYIKNDKSLLNYYNNYERILTEENKEQIEVLKNANNFDLI